MSPCGDLWTPVVGNRGVESGFWGNGALGEVRVGRVRSGQTVAHELFENSFHFFVRSTPSAPSITTEGILIRASDGLAQICARHGCISTSAKG